MIRLNKLFVFLILGAFCATVGCSSSSSKSDAENSGLGTGISTPSAGLKTFPPAPGSGSEEIPETVFQALTGGNTFTCSVEATYNANAEVGAAQSVSFAVNGYTTDSIFILAAFTSELSSPTALDIENDLHKFQAVGVTLIDGGFDYSAPQYPTSVTWLAAYQHNDVWCTTDLNSLELSTFFSTSSNSSNVDITLREIDGENNGNAPVRVAMVFREGEFFPGQVAAVVAETGQILPTQVDVLRRHDDNSIRHAMVSFVVPGFNANSEKTISFVNETPPPAPPFQTAFSAADLEAQVSFTGANGSQNVNASLQDIVPNISNCNASGGLSGDSAYWRFNGPIMKECVVWGHMRKSNGSAHGQLDVSFRVTTFSGVNGATVDVVVENTQTKLSSGDSSTPFADYETSNVILQLGNSPTVTAYQHNQNFFIWAGTRFRVPDPKQYKNDFADPEVVRDLEYLAQTRAVNMLQSVDTPVSYYYINGILDDDPMWPPPSPDEFYLMPKNMGQTGGANWIGTEPKWDRAWLATWNRNARDTSRGVHNVLALMYETHHRQSTSSSSQVPGGPIGIPCSQFNQLDPPITNAEGIADTAHQPRTSFPYLFTGELFHLEEMLFYTMWNYGKAGCVETGQQRAIGWSLRSYVDAAWLVPDGHPRYSYLQNALDDALDHYRSESVDSGLTFGVMNDEWNPTHLVNSGRPNWVNSRRHSPWQHSWVCWAFQLASKRGYSQADPIRDWVCNYLVNAYTVEDDPSQDWVGPDGQIYRYPAVDAMAYDAAIHYYPTLTPWHPVYETGCSQTNPYQYMNNGNFPAIEPENWGHHYYLTQINKGHEGYPVANLCFSENSDQASEWTPDNGWDTWEVNDYFDYGGNPGTAAVAEMALSGMDSAIDANKAVTAYTKNEFFKELYNDTDPLSLKPIPLY